MNCLLTYLSRARRYHRLRNHIVVASTKFIYCIGTAPSWQQPGCYLIVEHQFGQWILSKLHLSDVLFNQLVVTITVEFNYDSHD
jgi:hypothetical protein